MLSNLTSLVPLQEVLKHYGSEAALGPLPATLAQAAHTRRRERRAPGGNALLALLPKDVQVRMLGTPPRETHLLQLSYIYKTMYETIYIL